MNTNPETNIAPNGDEDEVIVLRRNQGDYHTKFRYLRSNDYFPEWQGTMSKLCISISTTLIPETETLTFCEWTVAYKAPSDCFNKVDARAALENNADNPLLSGSLALGPDYDHNEIVGKILMSLLLQDVVLTKHYYWFIRSLLRNHEGFSSFFS
jgi:hypothetical protein